MIPFCVFSPFASTILSLFDLERFNRFQLVCLFFTRKSRLNEDYDQLTFLPDWIILTSIALVPVNVFSNSYGKYLIVLIIVIISFPSIAALVIWHMLKAHSIQIFVHVFSWLAHNRALHSHTGNSHFVLIELFILIGTLKITFLKVLVIRGDVGISFRRWKHFSRFQAGRNFLDVEQQS